MGNGFLGCKGYNPLCCGTSHYEINNNVFGNYGEMKLDKDKKIITNIFIPNCQLKISPEGNIDKNKLSNGDNPIHLSVNPSKKRKFKLEKNSDKKSEIKNNVNKYYNIKNKSCSEKHLSLLNPGLTISSNISQRVKKFDFSNYNNDFLEYINKLRTTPNLVKEDIEYIMNNDVKTIEGKECIVSELTNEVVKIKENSVSFENIKEFLENEEEVNTLKLNSILKIHYINENIELTDKVINEIVLDKKREIISEFPNCFFYPIFIKDIKLNIIILLTNNIIREKIFYDQFSEFYLTTFNIKYNRFFAVLCFA